MDIILNNFNFLSDKSCFFWQFCIADGSKDYKSHKPQAQIR